MHSTAIFSEQHTNPWRLGKHHEKKGRAFTCILLSITCGCSCSAFHCVVKVSSCLNSTQFCLFHGVNTSLLFWCQLAGEVIHLSLYLSNSAAHFAYICCNAFYALLNTWVRMHCRTEPESRILTPPVFSSACLSINELNRIGEGNVISWSGETGCVKRCCTPAPKIFG